jgi:phosphomevalonate kinase
LTTATTNPTTTSPRFYNFNVPLSEAHKTGLGSSAALVTSITAALLSFYLPRSHFDLLPTSALASPSRRRLHNLAQAAHCAAQGKVGSGFDVASAVYGSSLYRRFSPSILSNHPEPGSPSFAPALVGLVEERAADPSSPAATPWDTEILQDAVKVPRGLRLVLCDVAGGSQTPGMVKQVLAWRAAQPAEADALWTELHAANQALAAELTALADAQPTGSLADDDGDEPAALRPLRAAFARIRASLRAMTRQTGVPIEPAAQTRLIDACEAVPGVVGGVVPGAGGYDAIALLIRDREDVVRALRELIAGWEFSGEEGVGGKVSMLGVREEMEGVRAEEARGYSL